MIDKARKPKGYRENNLFLGLCGKCNNPLSVFSTSLCEEHLDQKLEADEAKCFTPSPEYIRRYTKHIRKGWSNKEVALRLTGKREYNVPVEIVTCETPDSLKGICDAD